MKIRTGSFYVNYINVHFYSKENIDLEYHYSTCVLKHKKYIAHILSIYATYKIVNSIIDTRRWGLEGIELPV